MAKAVHVLTCFFSQGVEHMSNLSSHAHETFVKDTLPSWYVYTTDELRQRLHRDMLRSHHIRARLDQALSGMQTLTAFARPLLSDALEQAFGPGLDVDRDHFFHVRFAGGGLPLPGKLVDRSSSVQSLLEAALQNFHEEEVDSATADSVIFFGKPDLANFAAGTSYPHPLNITPAKFIALCRSLDLGGKYQAHLNDVLEPAAAGLLPDALNKEDIKDLLSHQARNALYVEAHLAQMQGGAVLSSGAYQSILAATGHWADTWLAEPVTIQHLTLLGFAVRDVLVFQAQGHDSCVVYMPGEPESPVQEYASLEQFRQRLRSKLREARYQQYFAGFVAQRSKASFLGKLRECLTPMRLRPIPGDTNLIPKQWKVPEADEQADLKIVVQEMPYSLLEFLYFQRMLRIKDDARALAVPTGDEDEASRRARLAGYLELGMSVANLAALFVPVLGEMMMVVAGGQLLGETFQGVEAWAHGDMDQVLEHLGSVAENLAMLAVFAAAGKAALPAEVPPIKASSFVGDMIPVKLADGQTRLWRPDLSPFATDLVLPEGMQPTTEGIFTHEGANYIALQGNFYPIELDTTLNKWRIKMPRGSRFAPQLEHNGAGAWRHEGESPLGWDVKTSFRRLGYSVASLSEQAAEEVLAVTNTDDALLATLHLDNQPPPPALTDTVERFGIDKQVMRFREQITDGAQFESADADLQLELLPSIPGWPQERVVRVADEAERVARHDRSIVVTPTQIADGKLLTVVLDALSESEKNGIFGADKSATPMDLGYEIGRVAEDRLPLLFEYLNQPREASDDSLVQLIKRDFPGIPVAAVHELLLEADTEELATMRSTQTIPLSIAGRARGYLQEARLNQALEGFFMASRADNPDTGKLALHLLQELPGWPQDLRIEIRDGAFGGPLLDSLGEHTTTQRSVLVKRGNTFQAFDIQGHELQPDPFENDNFFSAILHALPEAARDAIGFPDVLLDVAPLRRRIISEAIGQRERAAKIIGQREIKPGFRGPVRLADGRLGYTLSGGGAPLPDSVPAGFDELYASMSILYPDAPDLRTHVLSVFRRGLSFEELRSRTQTRLQSWEMLRSALEGWVNPTEAGRSISNEQFTVRRSVAHAISRAWRYSELLAPMQSANLLLEGLDLAGFSDLPQLPYHYADISYLTLSRVTGETEDINRLLRSFRNVRRLEILAGGLTALPDGLVSMRRLEHLSLEGMGLNIDQQAMNLLMDIPKLEELDLSGNVIGEFTDVSRLGLLQLCINNTGLTEWPAWTDNLGLLTLDISENQIVHLPEAVMENSTGHASPTTIHAYGNPIAHEDLRRYWLNDRGYGMEYQLEFEFPDDIRDLAVDTTSSDNDVSSDESDDEADWHVHNHSYASPVPPVPMMDIWLVEGRTELNTRLTSAWQSVETADDAPNLLVLLQRLREAPDFHRFHEELANDVMVVLEAVAQDTSLRGELEVMANDRLFGADQTCQDGARLIFSDIQVAVYARDALQGVPEAQHTETLFRVIRRLFRLNEVQTIADLEIASREARGVQVDHAEVRMAYRIGLANDLSLPGQPLSMAWDRLAAVDRQSILDARRLVLERETSDEFVNYAVADRRWNERLRVQYQADLSRVTAPIREQMEALEEHPPVDWEADLRRRADIYERLNVAQANNDPAALREARHDLEVLATHPPIDNDEYDRQGRALMLNLDAAEKALLEQLTISMRTQWF
jgi:hypothetical protein